MKNVRKSKRVFRLHLLIESRNFDDTLFFIEACTRGQNAFKFCSCSQPHSHSQDIINFRRDKSNKNKYYLDSFFLY